MILPDLHEAVPGRAECAQARTVEKPGLWVETNRDNSGRLALMMPGRDQQVTPTHWSFGQLCALVGAPTCYLRQLPATLSAINLQHGLLSRRAEMAGGFGIEGRRFPARLSAARDRFDR
ncbi:hypothetical protein [Bradyrhizobium sp.]|uniref:hypothetical protein n=1 Tax=Bradyrhizobium sp. TaxID=376 RepID=UPI003BB0415F